MGMRFENAFVVKAPTDRVWAYLVDPYRVATALPGAAITDKNDDGSYGGAITVKVGPVSAKYKGTVRFEKLDATAHTAEIAAKGQDVSGRGGADMRMESRLVEKGPAETEVTVVSDVNVTGILAQMGRGMIQDVSNQMLKKFTEAMRAELEKPEGAGDGGGGGSDTSTTTTATTSGTTSTSTNTSMNTSAVPAQPPIELVSFGGKILVRAVGRGMRRPVFWVVVAGISGLVYWLIHR
jgi:hypothetical protein